MSVLPHPTRALHLAAATAVAAAVLISCQPREEGYRATIRRTSYGIPHIEAADLSSLGFGEGYAQAEDHFCSVMDQVIRARGERARYFGRGEDDAHFASDLAVRALEIHRQAGDELAAASPTLRGWTEGYAAGINHFREEIGTDSLPGWCRGQPWVGPVSAQDLVAYRRLLGLMGPRFAGMIASAQPPGVGAETPSAAAALAAREPQLEMASNGWALGAERSENGGGLLIANPHYPWEGSNRFWEKQLTIPGELDAYGVGLIGSPGVAIGFNEHIAWTHTVSAGQRFTLYRLELVPGDPTSYLYDGEPRKMEAKSMAVPVKAADGSVETAEQTVYFSHYGPVLAWPGLGWTPEAAITFRDANEANDDSPATYQAMMRADSLDAFKQAHREHQGILFVNTIATSREGRAWYVDASAAPHLSAETIAAWRERLESDPATAGIYRRGILLLDGSSSRDEWVADERARDPGVAPFDEVPQLERSDYVLNANDSYWTSHHEAFLTGYSPAHGPEETARSLRTRMNLTTLSDLSAGGPAGEDGRFSLDELAAAALSNQSFAALLLRGELVERCRERSSVKLEGETVDLTEACAVLAEWEGRYNLESRGAVLFREFITGYESADLRQAGELFAVDFEPGKPIATPRGLAPGDLALERLAAAVKVLERADLPLDVPLGEVQYSNKRGGRIPIHGGQGTWEGIENVLFYSRNASTTLEPSPPVAKPVEGSRYLTEEGYPINYGTSFIMALELTADGPRGQAFLTYSQSGDWESPHFVDQTELFSGQQWRPILFSRSDIEADPNLEVRTVTARKGP